MKNIIRIAVVAALLGSLAGCVGYGYPMGNYGGDDGYGIGPAVYPGFGYGGIGFGGDGDGDGD